jgi:N-acetyl-gamma-glutamyl-phosphate reductase
MISVGIVGASGYTGEELVKILQNHPEVNIKSLTSRTHAGKLISDIFSLTQPLDGTFKTPTIENLIGCDVVFFATPNGIAMNMAEGLISKGIRVIDISADFRIRDVKVWEEWYAKKHASPSLLSQSIYGLPEIPGQKSKIRDALIVANPGCYPTASLLGLLPICNSFSPLKSGA